MIVRQNRLEAEAIWLTTAGVAAFLFTVFGGLFRFLPWFFLPVSLAPAQEAVRGFVSVEPFEFRLEALVHVAAYRESWRMAGEVIGPTEKQAVLDHLLGLFRSGVDVSLASQALTFTDETVRFIVPDPEKGYAPDERESIPFEEALVGMTLSAPATGVNAFDLEWLWFGPGQERVVLEIASRGKPAARYLTPREPRLSWKLDGEVALPALLPVPGLERGERGPLRPLVFVSLAMIAVATTLLARRRLKAPAWTGWFLACGIGLGIFALRYRTTGVVVPAGTAAEDLVYALLRNTYHAFDFRDESAIYDTLETSVSGPLLERIYLEMRSSLELESAGGPRVRVHEIALRECDEVPGAEVAGGGFRTRAEWVTIGEVTHWGHTHERTNRYEAEIGLTPAAGTWKISGLDLLDEERIQKVSRRVNEPPAP